MLYLFLTSYFSFDFWPPRFCVTSVSHQHTVGDSHKRGKHDLHPTSHGPLYRQIFLFWKHSKVWNPLLVQKRERKKQIWIFCCITLPSLNQSRLIFVLFSSSPQKIFFLNRMIRLRVAYHNWCCVCVPKGSTFFKNKKKDDVSFSSSLADGLFVTVGKRKEKSAARRSFGNDP